MFLVKGINNKGMKILVSVASLLFTAGVSIQISTTGMDAQSPLVRMGPALDFLHSFKHLLSIYYGPDMMPRYRKEKEDRLAFFNNLSIAYRPCSL